jgi:hypothetical protein
VFDQWEEIFTEGEGIAGRRENVFLENRGVLGEYLTKKFE